LNEALKTERLFALKVPVKEVLPPPPEVIPVLSAYLMELEEQMERLMWKITQLAEKSKVVAFSKILKGLEVIDQIRTFIILLFLAHKDKVDLWQREGSDEIFITLKRS
jgi:chromatin segregation and condensation protein Rec8/ScpA/Scc1 (kleisin family)